MSVFGPLEETIIDSATVTADENSASIDMKNHRTWSCQLVWTSTTAAGTVKMQESNDGTNWEDISGASQAISNDSGSTMFKSTDAFQAKYIRALVDFTSGSITTVQCYFVAKP